MSNVIKFPSQPPVVIFEPIKEPKMTTSLGLTGHILFEQQKE